MRHRTRTHTQPRAQVTETGLVRTVFGKTPIMSTYLLAFVVGEFDFISGRTPAGVEVRVFTPLGKAEMGRHALDCSLR